MPFQTTPASQAQNKIAPASEPLALRPALGGLSDAGDDARVDSAKLRSSDTDDFGALTMQASIVNMKISSIEMEQLRQSMEKRFKQIQAMQDAMTMLRATSQTDGDWVPLLKVSPDNPPAGFNFPDWGNDQSTMWNESRRSMAYLQALGIDWSGDGVRGPFDGKHCADVKKDTINAFIAKLQGDLDNANALQNQDIQALQNANSVYANLANLSSQAIAKQNDTNNKLVR